MIWQRTTLLTTDVFTLFKKYIEEVFISDKKLNEEQIKEHLNDYLKSENYYLYCISVHKEKEATVIGFILYYFERDYLNNYILNIKACYLLPEYRCTKVVEFIRQFIMKLQKKYKTPIYAEAFTEMSEKLMIKVGATQVSKNYILPYSEEVLL